MHEGGRGAGSQQNAPGQDGSVSKRGVSREEPRTLMSSAWHVDVSMKSKKFSSLSLAESISHAFMCLIIWVINVSLVIGLKVRLVSQSIRVPRSLCEVRTSAYAMGGMYNYFHLGQLIRKAA